MDNMYSSNKKNKLIIIIVAISVFVILALSIVAVLFLKTDTFKSNQEKFLSYFVQNINAMNKIIDTSSEEQYKKELEENSFDENTTIQFKYSNNEGRQETLTTNIKGIKDKEKNSSYKEIKVNSGNENIMNLEYLKEDQIYGIHFSDIVNEFATIDTANDMSNVAKYFGMENYITDGKINKIDLASLLTLTNGEKQKLEEKYLSVFANELQEENYSLEKGKNIKINNNDITANAYILNIEKTRLENICKKILQTLSEDEIILGKIESIDNSLKTDLKTKIVDFINKKADNINIESDLKITIYEQNKTTLMTTLEYNNQVININLNNESNVTINYSDSEKNTSISIIKNNSNIELNYEDDKQEKVSFSRNLENDNNQVKSIYYIKYTGNNKIKQLELNITRNLELGQASQIPTSFEQKGKILLNDYQNIDKVFNQLREKMVKYLRNKKDKTDSIVLEYIINYNNTLEEEEKNQEEKARKKFNSKFELYEGENLEKDIIANLIDEAGKNMSYYKKINDNKIHMYIQEGKENKEAVDEIKNILFNEQEGQQSSSENKKYNVKIHYDKNAKIDQILIEKIEEKQN